MRRKKHIWTSPRCFSRSATYWQRECFWFCFATSKSTHPNIYFHFFNWIASLLVENASQTICKIIAIDVIPILAGWTEISFKSGQVQKYQEPSSIARSWVDARKSWAPAFYLIDWEELINKKTVPAPHSILFFVNVSPSLNVVICHFINAAVFRTIKTI